MKKIKILLAEDDKNFGLLLKEFLEMNVFDVTLCKDGCIAWKTFSEYKFDFCLLDIMMPCKDGFTLAKNIRKVNKEIPIMFLTSKSMLKDRIEGLKKGADDYLTKPFNTEELLLRINAILRRSGKINNKKETAQFEIGNYKFNFINRSLKLNETEKILTTKEAKLLKLLCENKNEILKREYALNIIWEETNYFTARSMDVYITKLRKYLSKDPSIKITNIHGVGYNLTVKK